MSSYLAELERELSARPDKAICAAELLRALQPLAQAMEFIDQLQTRLMIVDTLPADAPFGALIRCRTGTVAQRATLYTGNGLGQPLAKLVPVPL